MAGYTRTVKFAGTAGEPSCVELPCFQRGKLDRLIVTQTSGTPGGGNFNVYDRKGACVNEVDLNVTESGAVDAIANSSGVVRLTTDADHNLKVGDVIEIKNCSVTAYNRLHTVTDVVSSTVVVTNVSHTSNASDGVWQTEPLFPSVHPDSSIVYTGSLSSGSLKAFDIDQQYENRDNQDVVMRTRRGALWLEITPDNSGNYEVSITTESDAMF